MNNFVQRTLSGAVYVGVVVGSILWHPMAFAAVFAIVTLWAIHEFGHLVQMSRFQIAMSMLMGALMFAGAVLDESRTMLCLCYVVVMLASLVAELFLKGENPINNWGKILQSQVMIALPFSLMNLLLDRDKYILLGLFVLIWINDSGAYCVGSLMAKRKSGNHKMFPRVSPKKSWEGLIGGILFAVGAGLLLAHFGWWDALRPGMGMGVIVALMASVSGTLGDLMESIMKRTIGVKDSGRFLPGHGGVLDRFDSMLLATPVLCILLLLC